MQLLKLRPIRLAAFLFGGLTITFVIAIGAPVVGESHYIGAEVVLATDLDEALRQHLPNPDTACAVLTGGRFGVRRQFIENPPVGYNEEYAAAFPRTTGIGTPVEPPKSLPELVGRLHERADDLAEGLLDVEAKYPDYNIWEGFVSDPFGDVQVVSSGWPLTVAQGYLDRRGATPWEQIDVKAWHESGRGGWRWRAIPLRPRLPGLTLNTVFWSLALCIPFVGLRAARRVARSRRNRCRVCAYDLRGNATGTCPECGSSVLRAPSAPLRSRLVDRQLTTDN